MKLTAILATALFTASVLADPPAKIDISRLPKQSKAVGDVIVPIPSEIFGVLDKLGRPNWQAVQRPLKGVAKAIGTKEQQALYLGTLIAEGFIAVESEDKDEVVNVGNSVLSLSQGLGVRKAVTARANAIINAANASKWQTVRQELDAALQVVREAMEEMGSANLAQLVSLGGWIRGTEALCEVVLKDYSRDGADLLHQPVLVEHFEDVLETQRAKHPLIPKLKAGLKAITPHIALGEAGSISKNAVKDVRDIAADLVKAIQTKP